MPVWPHSYDPGIAPSGLFWTIAIPEDRVKIHLPKGTASRHLRNVPILDAFPVANSLTGGAILGRPVPAAIVSADIE